MDKLRRLFRKIKVEIKYFSIKKFLSKIYYKIFYGIDFGMDGSMLPKTGTTKTGYSVKVKGAYIDIKDKSGEVFRIIPVTNAHGFYLELLDSHNKVKSRTCMSTDELRKIFDATNEASQ